MLVGHVSLSTVDIARHRLAAAFDAADTSRAEDVYVLSPDTLSRHEWLTLRLWRSEPGLTYTVGIDFVDAQHDNVQKLLSELYRIGRDGEHQEYVVLQTDPERLAKIGILCVMEELHRLELECTPPSVTWQSTTIFVSHP